jgi:hypothetical protein
MPRVLLYGLIALLVSLLGEAAYLLLRYYAYAEKPLDELQKDYATTGDKIVHLSAKDEAILKRWGDITRQ